MISDRRVLVESKSQVAKGDAEVTAIEKPEPWEAGGGMSGPHRKALRMLARVVMKIVREPWAKGMAECGRSDQEV